MESGIAIEAENLTKTYGDFTAISGINLAVKNGDFMGLVGPNGAGKSTTLKAITGLLKPTSGTVRISGIDISDHRHAMEHVGCVIETPEPYPGFTPTEVMDYIGRIYGMSQREIAIRSRDVLESVKMWEWRNKSISGFSKGMRQRIVIAQALLPNPDIIILDEPTSGLDPRGMVEMRRVLQNLKTRDRTLLISTHILSEVSELCGSVTMIRDGVVIASGDVSTLIHSRGYSGVTLTVRTVSPISKETLKDLSGMEGVTNAEHKGECTAVIAFKGTPEQQASLTKALFDCGAGILSINETGATLESMYMELTEDGKP
ncbi:MAG: ABC transporter ATP-binding protein [Candidatus Methanomethylophilaceae archaeon]|nr:ABC transporter ATP-binding protein [Candidatus Methanomethylophilaceae archaeon]